VFIVLSV